MTRAHAFAMGYKVIFHELNPNDYTSTDIPLPHHQPYYGDYQEGMELATKHKAQYAAEFQFFERLD